MTKPKYHEPPPPLVPMSADVARAEWLAQARRWGCDCEPRIQVPERWGGRLIGSPLVHHQAGCAMNNRRRWRYE